MMYKDVDAADKVLCHYRHYGDVWDYYDNGTHVFVCHMFHNIGDNIGETTIVKEIEHDKWTIRKHNRFPKKYIRKLKALYPNEVWDC